MCSEIYPFDGGARGGGEGTMCKVPNYKLDKVGRGNWIIFIFLFLRLCILT